MAEHWSHEDDADSDYDGEPDSLYAATAPFCDSAVGLTRADGVCFAMLSASPNSRELVFTSNVKALHLDELQFALGEGPCLASFRTRQPVCIADTDHDDRWPSFCREAAEIGVRAVFSFPVSIHSQAIGVLELHRRWPGGLTVDEYDAALGCAAAVGAVATAIYDRWTQRSDDDELDGSVLTALTESDPFSRSGVYVAARMIAAHRGVSVSEALARMRAYAFANDQRVTLVAERIVDHRIPMSDWDDDAP